MDEDNCESNILNSDKQIEAHLQNRKCRPAALRFVKFLMWNSWRWVNLVHMYTKCLLTLMTESKRDFGVMA
jgi:hypothetical protein